MGKVMGQIGWRVVHTIKIIDTHSRGIFRGTLRIGLNMLVLLLTLGKNAPSGAILGSKIGTNPHPLASV